MSSEFPEILNVVDEPIILPEPLLMSNPQRFCLYPIKYDNIWKLYKQSQASIWTAEEIDLTMDIKDWNILSSDEKTFLSHVLAFFATADGIINENIDLNFASEIQIPEARAFYHFQSHIEDVHAETYSLLLQTYVKNEKERRFLFDAIKNIDGVKLKAEWAMKWSDSNYSSFAQRLVAVACVEGIFFSGSFCSIFWLKNRGLLPGLGKANEFISRDEGLHVMHAVELYRHVVNRLTTETINSIIKSAVDVEKLFITDALNVRLIGMNADMMCTYIEYCADRLLIDFGYPKFYKATNPFDFMERISLQGKTNFFEQNVTEYAKSGVGIGSMEEHHTLAFDEEF